MKDTLSKPRVYLAGKISSNDWRIELLRRRPASVVAGGGAEEQLFDPDHVEDCGEFDYGGPFFVACDHRCAHVAQMHGAGVNEPCFGGAFDEVVGGQASEDVRRRVWDVNRERLRRADLVFAYINEVDCFGTLIELGLAAAWGKRIVVVFGERMTDEQIADLWMARMGAVRVHAGDMRGNLHAALRRALQLPGGTERRDDVEERARCVEHMRREQESRLWDVPPQ